MAMDMGEIFNCEFEIMPASEGGFIVLLGRKWVEGDRTLREHYGHKRWASSNVSDLLAWLQENAEAYLNQKAPGAPPEGS